MGARSNRISKHIFHLQTDSLKKVACDNRKQSVRWLTEIAQVKVWDEESISGRAQILLSVNNLKPCLTSCLRTDWDHSNYLENHLKTFQLRQYRRTYYLGTVFVYVSKTRETMPSQRGIKRRCTFLVRSVLNPSGDSYYYLTIFLLFTASLTAKCSTSFFLCKYSIK